MTSTRKQRKIASSLILVSILFSITLAYATTENNYKNDNNLLTDISENNYTENGYKVSIIANPNVVGICANENGYKLDLAINPTGIGGAFQENNYKLDLIPEKTFPDISDITITNITISKTVVGQGYSMLINVTFLIQAFKYTTFCTTINANTTTIKTQTITLTSASLTTITIAWNTTGFVKGNYTIWTYAWSILGETNTADNNFTDGMVYVGIPGDVDGNHFVEVKDLLAIALAYGSFPSQPKYKAELDVNGDEFIDVKDILTAALNYGQIDP